MIFKWFAEDFGDETGVLNFISKYNPNYNSHKITEYLDYNWKLNSE